MADLTRISISLEENLLESFDKLIAAKGYATRSEAIRDLIRDLLIRAGGPQPARRAGGRRHDGLRSPCPRTGGKLIDKQHHHHDLVVSSLHVHLGERHCLEVSVLRGPGTR